MGFLLNPFISFGGFSPADIPDLRVWFDAQDDAQITVVDTDKADVWASKLGAVTLNMTSPAGFTNKPIIEDVSGKQMLLYSAARYHLGSPGTNFSPGTGPMTIVTVSRTTQTSRGAVMEIGPLGTEGIKMRYNVGPGTGELVEAWTDSTGSNLVFIDSDVTHNDGAVRVHHFEKNASSADGNMWTDNVASSLNPVTDSTAAMSANLANIRFGRRTAGDWNLTGHIGEIIIYFRALSTNERTALHDYLKVKWGL